MMSIKPSAEARFLLIGKILLMLVFAISFQQSPLYTFNQNTYFVHGLAHAHVGFLDLDWLSQTTDPFPLFSALVSITIQVLSEHAFYFLYMAILAIYIYSILGIARIVFGIGSSTEKYLFYFVLITMLYSGLFVRLLSNLPGLQSFAPSFDPNGILTRGVAEQTTLGPIFQPSVFGVFLLLSMYAFLREKPFVTGVCLAIAATFHASYLLSAGVLTCIYVGVIVVQERDFRKALFLGATMLLLTAPALIYAYLNFKPTTADLFAQAQSILVDFRIPHHAVVARWFGASTVFQIMLVALSIYLVRRSRMYPILLGLFLVAMILTAAQILTANKSLALLLPWRISVLLVPIATSLIIAKLVSVIFQLLNDRISRFVRPLQVVILAVIIMLGSLGVYQTITLLNTPRTGLSASTRFVASTYQVGDVYLIPPDMESFRLAAEVPIFVDRKSNPYKDIDVVEWFNRLKLATEFYAADEKTACNILDEISDKYQITDVIRTRGSSITHCGLLHEVYRDADIAIYTVRGDEGYAEQSHR